MTLEDEIEFYGFVPLYLLKNVEEKVRAICKDDEQKQKALDQNFSIFEDYVLQNCFDFPKSFSLERKLTDNKLNANLQNDIDEYVRLLEEIKYMKIEKARITHENDEMLGRMEELRGIKQQIMDLQNEMANSKNILKRIEHLEELENRTGSIAVNPNESTLTVLVEDVKFKKVIEKKEKEDFLNVYDMANIDKVLDNFKN